MARASLEFHDVTFSYPQMSMALLDGFTCRFHRGWTGVVGANGSGKSTLLKLATGLLEPEEGEVTVPEFALYCEQRTDAPPDLFEDLAMAEEKDAVLIRADLAIEADWLRRWDALSHGERKRAQVGVMLWRRPDVLAVDEPTNHLDAAAKTLLVRALSRYRGIGLLVSHDRELLDHLCTHCLFVDPPELTLRRGGFTQGWEAARQEAVSTERRRARARAQRKKIERESTRRREAASASDRRRSKRGLAPGDHDGRDKIDRARVTGKDAVAGKLYRQLQGRLEQARRRESEARVKKNYEMGIWLPGEESKRDVLFALEPETLALGPERSLRHDGVSARPGDRIALTGPNGAGKSTLIRRIVSSLNIPGERLTYVPQEIDAVDSARILADARELPHEALGRTMAVISRLGSRPERLLESVEPSPGETRKLLLAIGIARQPHLIIMDEPTNHMDLPSIQCLESALTESPCALLLVSHDIPFLVRLTRRRWDIARASPERVSTYELHEISWD